MEKYPKIQTLFKRNEKGIIIPSEYTLPEFELLKNIKWEATEKIDGTNIRVQLRIKHANYPSEFATGTLISGRTDNA